ncbi:hypothetical protein LCE32_10375, partial [Streptomyces sp. 7G]|uniref:hypothetical protein n=1 Tax=Streptomyces sp. 7G TaxID=2877241 RepID=UPI001CD811EB
MAFSADELRVLRRALAIALHPMPLSDEDVQDCLRLAGSVDEAVGEAGRLRAFLLADLARYRNALPGSATGYLELLQDALAAGYDPRPDDLAALRALRGGKTSDGLGMGRSPGFCGLPGVAGVPGRSGSRPGGPPPGPGGPPPGGGGGGRPPAPPARRRPPAR